MIDTGLLRLYRLLILGLFAMLLWGAADPAGAVSTSLAFGRVQLCNADSPDVFDGPNVPVGTVAMSSVSLATIGGPCEDRFSNTIVNETAFARASVDLATGILAAVATASGGGRSFADASLNDSFDVRAQRAGTPALIFLIRGILAPPVLASDRAPLRPFCRYPGRRELLGLLRDTQQF